MTKDLQHCDASDRRSCGAQHRPWSSCRHCQADVAHLDQQRLCEGRYSKYLFLIRLRAQAPRVRDIVARTVRRPVQQNHAALPVLVYCGDTHLPLLACNASGRRDTDPANRAVAHHADDKGVHLFFAKRLRVPYATVVEHLSNLRDLAALPFRVAFRSAINLNKQPIERYL